MKTSVCWDKNSLTHTSIYAITYFWVIDKNMHCHVTMRPSQNFKEEETQIKMVLKPSSPHYCDGMLLEGFSSTRLKLYPLTEIKYSIFLPELHYVYQLTCFKSVLILIDVYTAFSAFKIFLHTVFHTTQRTSHRK